MKKNTLIAVLGVVLVIIIIAIIVSRQSSTQTLPFMKTPSITGVSNENNAEPRYMNIDQNYIDVNKRMIEDPERQEEAYRSSKVGELVDIVPFKGNLFSLEYSYETAKFTVTLQQGQLPQANAEFDAFLNEHGVESQDWIEDLEVKLQ